MNFNRSNSSGTYYPTFANVPTQHSEDAEENNGDDSAVPAIVNHQSIYVVIVAVIGIIANLFVIGKTVSSKRKLQRRRPNWATGSTSHFVLSLSVSNIGTLAFAVAFTVLPYYVSFPITEFSCRYILPARELFIAVSIFSITFIAVDRFLVHCKTVHKRLVKSSSKLPVVMLWVFCYLLFAFPFSFVYKVVHVDGAYICDAMWKSAAMRRVHITLMIIFNVFLPGIVVFLCYLGVIRNLAQVHRCLSEPPAPQNSIRRNITKSKKIVTVSVLMVIAFGITYIPFSLLSLAVEYGDPNSSFFEHLELLYAIATCLVYSSAMVFPIILLFAGHSFKLKSSRCLRVSLKVSQKMCREGQRNQVKTDCLNIPHSI